MVGARFSVAGMSLGNSSYASDANYLAVGGQACSFEVPNIYPTATALNVVERFYDDSETWSIASPTISARCLAAGGGNLIIGGVGTGGAGAVSGSVEGYNRFLDTWSTQANLITPRSNGHAAAGCIVFGGFAPAGVTNATEQFNGTTWSTVNSLQRGGNEALNLAGAGNESNALAFGGNGSCATEEWNGSTWSPGGNMITARKELAGGGYANSALAFGGTYSSAFANTEQYDGTNWTEKGALPIALCALGGGRQVDSSATTALAFGGFQYGNGPYGTAQTNKYCSVSFNRSAFNFDSTNNTVATGSFLGSLKGTLDGTATYAYEANNAISATTATTASYVEADSVDFSALTHYNDDTAAAAAGVPIGGLYRNGNFVAIRLT